MPKKKIKRNLNGLRNQPQQTTDDGPQESLSPSPIPTRAPTPISNNESVPTLFDSLKVDWQLEDGLSGSSDLDSEESEAGEVFDDPDLTEELLAAIQTNDGDPDWLPAQELRQRAAAADRKPRGPYGKGPDVMSKSDRTRRRYAAAWRTQTRLTSSGFTKTPNFRRLSPQQRGSPSPISIHGSDSEDDARSPPASLIPSIRPRSLSVASSDGDLEDAADAAVSEEIDTAIAAAPPVPVPQLEAWEDELDENVVDPAAVRKSWPTLLLQIQAAIKKEQKTATLSRLNKLLMLQSFAVLLTKGHGRVDASLKVAEQWRKGRGSWLAYRIRDMARFYAQFERLPLEKRGGARMSRSFLHREPVRVAVLAFLNGLPTGKVTPRILARQVTNEIFPSLDIQPKQPLSIRTARRWLFRLGWVWSRVKKGIYVDGHEREDVVIYVDGHEREDVVKYRQEVFLPQMAEFQRRIANWEYDSDLQHWSCEKPKLAAGERELIPFFQDECAAHANENTETLWLRKGENPLRKKGRGRLIHISDFINPVTGRLFIRGEDGEIARDARKIIYPGANGDPWWDCDQLLVQMKDAIDIFDTRFPEKQALFVFDNSSAHGSLGPDSLKAFEMNKGDGGKQRKQRDTVIPETNPCVELRGKPQQMTLPNGDAKGLKRVLEERGFDVAGMRAKCKPVCPIENTDCCMARLLSHQDDFKNQISMLETLVKGRGHEIIFLPKFHCELNPIEMYWGWFKYRYREHDKPNFQAAKDAAKLYLDACPLDVIRRFINRSFRWMDVYRAGLTGAAAEWAVRKQKQHRGVSQSAAIALDDVARQARPS
ncbi:hypothetical protein MKEN_00590500 [Mycena kentingensis (nom. inval.)]|nr:hypothetical protein MKEN_00590500 [Mycena kentingensis (nom. inval.)]